MAKTESKSMFEHDGAFSRQLDRALTAQRPTAIAFVRRMRRKAPNATPEQLLRAAEHWYRRSAMATGGGVGAASVIPGVGTAVGVTIAGVEVVGFLELTALYALVVAEIHGDATEDPVRARTLVMALLLGEQGKRLIKDFAMRRGAGGIIGTAVWGELVTQAMPEVVMGELGRRMRDMFLRQFGKRQVGGMIGKVLPFGVGAAVGALGNRALANEVVRNAQDAFGPAPKTFVGELSDSALARADAAADERQIQRAIEKAERERRQLSRGKGADRGTGGGTKQGGGRLRRRGTSGGERA